MYEIEIQGIRITIEKKKIKNMYLKVAAPEGRVMITAPQGMPDHLIREFAASRTAWVEKQQKKYESHPRLCEHHYTTGEEILSWGRRCIIQIAASDTDQRISLEGGCMVFKLPAAATAEQREALLKSWYREQLEQAIPPMLEKWEKIVGVKASSFGIRDMKTRWGSCNVRTKRICLNLQLARKGTECLAYVVLHELVHLLEASHNAVFKAYMDQFMPDWKTIRRSMSAC